MAKTGVLAFAKRLERAGIPCSAEAMQPETSKSLKSLALSVIAALPLVFFGIALDQVRSGRTIGDSEALTLALLCAVAVGAVLLLARVLSRLTTLSYHSALVIGLSLLLFTALCFYA
jgi:hypothetical protein